LKPATATPLSKTRTLRSLRAVSVHGDKSMKQFLWSLAMAIGLAFTMAPIDAEAKRLGGGKSQGMQRQAPPDKPAQSTPATPNNNAATPAPANAGAAAAAAPSWMGPIAGMAAGLGLAALFSSLGLGEGLANFVMMALLAVAAFFVIRLLMRRFAGSSAQRPPLAMAGAGAGAGAAAARPAAPTSFVDERPGMQRNTTAPSVTIGSALAPPLAVPGATNTVTTTAPTLPADFDGEGFERLAKMLFIRLQTANDKADLNDLRNFTTPELFAALRMDLHDRGDKTEQHTDVVKVDAQLIDFAQEAEQQIVSVRFTGAVKEEADADATPFDEVWHVVKPLDDSRSWAIAGIQQRQ
jgi:predicted lipid-binding transport protein (Tim44 family)